MKQYVHNYFKKIVTFLAILTVSVSIVWVPAYALDDGAYVVSRTTSYANPETGQIVDGGTDQALGDSMCAGIVEGQALVEQSGGKTYVTLGIGLASNASNVRIQVQTSAGGGFKGAGLTKTGSCSRDGDTCNHYRFEVIDPSLLISPVIYVNPMGRDVQFFVRLNVGGASKGTGNFVSQMVQEPSQTEEPPMSENTDQIEDAAEEEVAADAAGEEEREIVLVDFSGDPMVGVAGLSLHIVEEETSDEEKEPVKDETKSSLIPYAVGGSAVVIGAGTGAFVFFRKRKGGL